MATDSGNNLSCVSSMELENNEMDLDLGNGSGDNHVEYFDEDLGGGLNNVHTKFDETIGHIEDIVMDEEFQTMQNTFLDTHYTEFENTEENKFIYTDIHKEYCDKIEKYIEAELQKRVEDFSMTEFAQELEQRRDELDGEIFEILLTFSDFVLFKEMFLDYKASKEGNYIDLSTGINIKNISSDQSKIMNDFTLSST